MQTPRQYGLYYKIGKRYYRVRQATYRKETAVQVFQDALLGGLQWHACLRPTNGHDHVYLVLTGAYGKQYTTPEAALAAWQQNKDFQILGGPYCSIRDSVHGLIRLNDPQQTLVPVEGTGDESSA